MSGPPLPRALRLTCRRHGFRLTRHILLVWVDSQSVDWLELQGQGYRLRRRMLASTSRFGVGQMEGSNCTPLGLHRVARQIGSGWPQGTVFQARQPTGFTWDGRPRAPIAHRVLWLEGLEPGYNAGGGRDSFRRFIYIHGVGDELTLGRPASRGCVHLAAPHIIELAAVLPEHSLVWIALGPATPRRLWQSRSNATGQRPPRQIGFGAKSEGSVASVAGVAWSFPTPNRERTQTPEVASAHGNLLLDSR